MWPGRGANADKYLAWMAVGSNRCDLSTNYLLKIARMRSWVREWNIEICSYGVLDDLLLVSGGGCSCCKCILISILFCFNNWKNGNKSTLEIISTRTGRGEEH